jgi:Flp pilus assembly protein CpaB
VKRSNRLVILVGVLLAVLAFVGIVVLLNQDGGTTPPEEESVAVLVALEDIAIGDPVTSDLAEVREVPAEAVEQTRLSDTSQLTGTPALVPITAGSQITAEKAGQPVAGQPPSPRDQLQAGEKAIAFQVDRVTGLDFLLVPGDHIDIVIAQDVTPIQQTADSVAEQQDNQNAPARYEAVTGLSNVRTVKTIIQDRRVLYVSQTRLRPATTGTASPSGSAAPAEQQQIDSVIIVFAGSDQDAELIKFAQRDLNEVGSLTAVLRRTEDTEEGVEDPATTGITLNLLVEEYGVPVPDIIVLATQSPRPRGGN